MSNFTKISRYISSAVLSVFLLVGFYVAVPQAVFAQTQQEQKDAICDGAGGCDQAGPGVVDTIHSVINIIIFFVGIVSVLMVIIGGLRYTLSHGDSSATKAAKDTIMYALVGVVVSFISYAIVEFVISNL